MPKNQHRSDHTKDHVRPKPEANGTNGSQSLDPLPQRVQQQKQHKAASRDPEPITDTALGCKAIVFTVNPTDPKRGDDNAAKQQGDSLGPKLRAVLRRFRFGARSFGGSGRPAAAAGIRPPLRDEALVGKFRNRCPCHCLPNS